MLHFMMVARFEGLCEQNGIERCKLHLFEAVVQTEVKKGRVHAVIGLFVVKNVEIVSCQACVGN